MEAEETLTGGTLTAVSRVGNTVRRAAGPWSAQVHQLLRTLRAQGLEEVPEPLGFDEKGREILTFLPGEVGHFPTPALRSDVILVAAAHLLQRMHAATLELAQTCPSGWQAATREPIEVICHGDFAPYNCVFEQGRLIGAIDFDHAHPGPRAWDLAYALYRFVPLMDPSNPESYGSFAEQARRARLFCEAYGLPERSGLVATLLARVAAMADNLRQGAALGDPRYQANIEAGHLQIYTTDYAYLETHQDQLQQMLGA